MKVVHILSSFGLILLTALGTIHPLLSTQTESELIDRLTAFGMFTGLFTGFVLFTGFFQLGSVNTVPDVILYKLGYTVLGGGVALFAYFARANGFLSNLLFYCFQGLALLLFVLSLFWALGL